MGLTFLLDSFHGVVSQLHRPLLPRAFQYRGGTGVVHAAYAHEHEHELRDRLCLVRVLRQVVNVLDAWIRMLTHGCLDLQLYAGRHLGPCR